MEPYAQENAHQPGLDRLAFDFSLGVRFALSSNPSLAQVLSCAESVLDIRRIECSYTSREKETSFFVPFYCAEKGLRGEKKVRSLSPQSQSLL